jgi:hypothetical protein
VVEEAGQNARLKWAKRPPRWVPPGEDVKRAARHLKGAETRLRNAVLAEVEAGTPIMEIARWSRVSPRTIRRWRDGLDGR